MAKKDGVLASLIKHLTEAVLEAEIESHLSTEINNRKNGKSSKTIKSAVYTILGVGLSGKKETLGL